MPPALAASSYPYATASSILAQPAVTAVLVLFWVDSDSNQILCKHVGRVVSKWGWADVMGLHLYFSSNALIVEHCHQRENWDYMYYSSLRWGLICEILDMTVSLSTAVFPRKRSNVYFIWGVARIAPEWEMHFREVSRITYRVCKSFLGESSAIPLCLLMEKKFQQHRKGKCVCKHGLIFPLESRKVGRY